MNRASILDESKRLTTTDREKDYGDCVATHRKIASMWSLILSEPIGAEEVALCMAAVKIIRAAYDPKNVDHFIDGAAYMAIAGECAGVGDKTPMPKPVASAEQGMSEWGKVEVRTAYVQGREVARRSKAALASDCPYSPTELGALYNAWMDGLRDGRNQAQESEG